MSDQLKFLATDLVSAFQGTGLLGEFRQSSLPAIAVDPGNISNDVDGLRVTIRRVPISPNGPETVIGGTYFGDLYVLELVQFQGYQDYADPGKADVMRQAIRLIESRYNVQRRLYFAPSREEFERALLYVFLPDFELR